MGKIDVILEKSDGATFPISTQSTATVLELKHEIASKLRISKKELVLLFCGRELSDSSTLDSCSVLNGMMLGLEFRTAQIELTFESEHGQINCLKVSTSATNEDFFRMLKEANIALPDNPGVVIADEEWSDNVTLGEFLQTFKKMDDEDMMVRIIAKVKGGRFSIEVNVGNAKIPK